MLKRAFLAASLVLSAGCLEAVDDFDTSRSRQPAIGAVDVAGQDAGSLAELGTPDAGAVPAYDCLGYAGPSQPNLFSSMTGWAAVRDCPSSACVDFVDLDAQCTFGLQTNNVRTTALLSTADCDGLKRWLTSDVLLAGLRSACGDFTGNESLEVETTDPTLSSGKKFDGCTEEPFPSHRACLKAVRARYFPGR